MLEVDFSFPGLPANFAQDLSQHRALADRLKIHVEPCGRPFEFYAQRKVRGRTLSEDEKEAAELDSDDEAVEHKESDVFDKLFEETNLKGLDPSEWKKQDHYELLGLHHLRYKATNEHINRAYKLMVMKHHPDKKPKIKTADGSMKDDDAYFKCLKIAHEWLNDPTKRRSYDSCDPEFDDDAPECSQKEIFKVYGPIFEENGRFSEVLPVPPFGTIDSTKEEVETFYDFWYNFKSWREFSYEDAEDASRGSNRDEKRWLEKKNLGERKKKKKEESTRVSAMVDWVFKNDPRIKLLKEKERKQKEEAKNAREKEAKEKKEAEQAAAVEAKKEEERKKEEEKQAAAEKRRRDKANAEAKKAVKDEFLNKCKGVKFFQDPEADFDKHIANIKKVNKMVEDIEAQILIDLNANFSEEAIFKAIDDLEKAQAAEVAEKERLKKEAAEKAAKEKAEREAREAEEKRLRELPHEWTEKEIQLLVKGVKLFPPGSRNRWDNLLEYISTRVESCTITEKQLIDRVKIQGSSQVDHFDKFNAKTPKIDNVEAQGGISVTLPDPNAWTPEQQKQLEKALVKHKGIAAKDGKFDKVAEDVEGKDKEQCLARFKYLADQVKAKKNQGKKPVPQKGKGKRR